MSFFNASTSGLLDILPLVSLANGDMNRLACVRRDVEPQVLQRNFEEAFKELEAKLG